MPINQTPYVKWVTCWGNATSITDRREATYAKDLTLRYPIRMFFAGNRLRLRFSNLTGTEPVTITRVYVAHQTDPYEPIAVTMDGGSRFVLPPGEERESDEVAIEIEAGETIDVSFYLEDYTQLNAGTLITGPLSLGQYSYGDHAALRTLPLDLSRRTSWFYFLNTIDIWTEEQNHALICYGDSITAQSWPDYLSLRAWEEGHRHVAIVRRAVSGTRILRQYDSITYQAYGLKGATRFPIEMNVAGARAVILQHGINDIIHPVGVDVNPFRPWSDLPSVNEMTAGFEQIYIEPARRRGLSVWGGTLLPIGGWRTYAPFREEMRTAFNRWLLTTPLLDGCIDFDRAVCDPQRPDYFAPGFDSGDHLHPSEAAYKAMADCVPAALL